MRKIMGFDIDGVLYPWHLYVWKDIGIEYTYDWFWTEVKDTIPESEWYKIASNQRYVQGMPYSHAPHIVRQYFKEYKIFYMTNRPISLRYLTTWWLKSWGFPSYNKVIFTEDKTKEIRNIQPEYFIEDKSSNIEKLKDLTNIVAVYQVYNRNYLKENPNIPVIDEIRYLPSVIPLWSYELGDKK